MIKNGEGGTVALVQFELPAEVAASSAAVCGEFNDWSPHAQPLLRLDNGGFRTVLELPTGRRWRFRYLLDGHRWENDWAADDYILNGYGTHDSVVDLTVPPAPAPAPATATARVKPVTTPRRRASSEAVDAAPAAAPRRRRAKAAKPAEGPPSGAAQGQARP